MRRDKPVDPAWLEWAEQETIRLLGTQLEARRAARRPAPPTADPIRVVHEIDLDRPEERQINLEGAAPSEIDLDRPEERQIDLADPAAPEVRVAARSNGLVIRIHRENV